MKVKVSFLLNCLKPSLPGYPSARRAEWIVWLKFRLIWRRWWSGHQDPQQQDDRLHGQSPASTTGEGCLRWGFAGDGGPQRGHCCAQEKVTRTWTPLTGATQFSGMKESWTTGRRSTQLPWGSLHRPRRRRNFLGELNVNTCPLSGWIFFD